MRSRVKTGDVIQIRRNGPNYIALGKVRDHNGKEYVAATKNGNVTVSGKMKRGQTKIHIIKGDDVKKVHSSRNVDMASVCNSDRRLGNYLERTTRSNGVKTNAPNIMAQLQDLQTSL